MVNPEDIKGWISEKLACDFIELDGDGQHFEAVIVIRGGTRHGPDCAVDVECDAAGSADQVMMVVTHTSLEPGRGSSRLDTADEVRVDHHAECVVHRLARDRPDHRADVLGQLVGRRVGARRHSPQNCQPLLSFHSAARPR